MRRVLLLCGSWAILALSGCASSGFQPIASTMPAAKAGLQPEFRVFYDALEDYGDWVLIEPYGYVFRPRVSFVSWRPYNEGFWVPSDIWGWVWISAEPFGWATYHYGTWFNDSYQGWVWAPGLDWGPAWVSWQIAEGYAGWSPLGPRGVDFGGYTYVPLSQLGSTSLQSAIVPAAQIADKLANAKSVENTVVRGGVKINRGPPLDLVERVAGPLSRVRLAEVGPGAAGGKRGPGAGASSPTFEDEIEATRRAAEDAANQAKLAAARGGAPPPRLSMVRPALVPARTPNTERRVPGRGRSAPRDSTR